MERKLQERGYILSKDSFDLAIAVGGDGSFLNMIKKCDFDEKINYIGVHTGTLGFSQEIDPNKIDDFLLSLENEDYKIEKIGRHINCLRTNNYSYTKRIYEKYTKYKN